MRDGAVPWVQRAEQLVAELLALAGAVLAPKAADSPAASSSFEQALAVEAEQQSAVEGRIAVAAARTVAEVPAVALPAAPEEGHPKELAVQAEARTVADREEGRTAVAEEIAEQVERTVGLVLKGTAEQAQHQLAR